MNTLVWITLIILFASNVMAFIFLVKMLMQLNQGSKEIKNITDAKKP